MLQSQEAWKLEGLDARKLLSLQLIAHSLMALKPLSVTSLLIQVVILFHREALGRQGLCSGLRPACSL